MISIFFDRLAFVAKEDVYSAKASAAPEVPTDELKEVYLLRVVVSENAVIPNEAETTSFSIVDSRGNTGTEPVTPVNEDDEK